MGAKERDIELYLASLREGASHEDRAFGVLSVGECRAIRLKHYRKDGRPRGADGPVPTRERDDYPPTLPPGVGTNDKP